MHTRTIHILQSTYEDLSNSFRGTSGHSAFSQVSPNYFRHMLYSAAGSTPSAPSNPGRGRIDTLRKRMGRSFQSPQDRSGDQEESGRSCQSNKENKQKNLNAWALTVCKQSGESTCFHFQTVWEGSTQQISSCWSIVVGSHRKCHTGHFPKVVAAWRQRYIWSEGQTGSHRYHNESVGIRPLPPIHG